MTNELNQLLALVDHSLSVDGTTVKVTDEALVRAAALDGHRALVRP